MSIIRSIKDLSYCFCKVTIPKRSLDTRFNTRFLRRYFERPIGCRASPMNLRTPRQMNVWRGYRWTSRRSIFISSLKGGVPEMRVRAPRRALTRRIRSYALTACQRVARKHALPTDEPTTREPPASSSERRQRTLPDFAWSPDPAAMKPLGWRVASPISFSAFSRLRTLPSPVQTCPRS